MAEILVKVETYIHPDPVVDLRGVYKPGDVVDIRPDGFLWGREECLPKFVLLKIPGVDPATIQHYRDAWEKRLSWDVVAYSQAQDGYRLDVYANLVRVSDNANILTRAEVEAWLNKWNASVVSVTAGKVRFDIGVYQAMCSPGFLDVDNVTNVVFTKESGDGTTDSYRIASDWSAKAWSVEMVEHRLTERAAVINSSAVGYTTYTISRDTAIVAFKQAVQERVEVVYTRKRWYYSSADLASAVAAGGIATLTPAQAIAKLSDKVSE